MGTFIDGIGASENIDSSGERIMMAGLDISSLTVDGVFNYEHKNDQPNQIVGKILKAKIIYSDADCDDDRMLYYWQKVQTPYLYVMGELFDDYKESAKDIAGMFRYDLDKKAQNERNVMNFSVEGAKIQKEGMDIVRSIARKITITVLPCNKMAIAEMVPAQASKPKDDLDGIFKTETSVEVELIKADDAMALWEMIKKEDPSKHAAKLGIAPMKKEIGMGLELGGDTALSGGAPMGGGMTASEKKAPNMKKDAPKLSVAKPGKDGIKIGRTSSGRDVMSHGRVGEYGFNSKEHAEAGAAHEKAAQSVKNNPRLGSHHWSKAKLHYSAANSGKDTHARQHVTDKQIAAPAPKENKKLHDPDLSGKVNYKKSEMNKGLDDGAKNTTIGARKPSAAPRSDKLKITQRAGPTSVSISTSMPGGSLVGGMAKAISAGSSNAAPGQLAGGSALAPESLQGKKNSTIKTPNVSRPDAGFGAIIHKSKWLARAEQEYEKWDKKEHFRSFMKSRLPKLAMGEIDAIGKTIALSKSLKAEKALKKFAGAQNFQHSFVEKKEKK